MLRGHSPPRPCFAKHYQSANRSADVQNSCGVALGLRGGRGALAQEVLGPRKCAREGCFTTPKPQRSHLAAHENARQHAAPHAPLVLDRHAILDNPRSSSGEPRGGLLTPAKDQRAATLLLTLVCCRFRDRSTGPVGGCGATTGGWNSGRRQQERAPGRVPRLLAAGRWRRAQRGERAVRSHRRSPLASRPADMMR